MSDKRTTPTATTEGTTMDSVKKTLGKAADLTSLKLKQRRIAARRKDAYTRLGELSYAKYRPRNGAVPADIEIAIEDTMREITALSMELTELSLRVELVKTDMKK